MSRGATDELIAKLADAEASGLPDRTRAALALADHLSRTSGPLDPEMYEELRRWFTEDQILDLGMCLAFTTGWQRFIEAFGVVPDHWVEGAPPPWRRDQPAGP